VSAYGDDPRYHQIVRERFVCSAPDDAPCRTSPTCDCEFWCGCDGSPEDAVDAHDGEHCCMTTTKPGRECWMVAWVEATGLEDSFTGDTGELEYGIGGYVWPSGPVTCEWDEGVFWEYAGPVQQPATEDQRREPGPNDVPLFEVSD